MFYYILQNRLVSTVFQPIISLRDCSVLGYEALSRGPKDTEYEDPQKLLDLAQQYEDLWDLEYLFRYKALESAAKIDPKHKLFINVNPNIIHDKMFSQGFTRQYLEQFSIKAERIVFEITEQQSIGRCEDFVNAVIHYKEQKYNIAIDDAGAGYSGLNLISDLHPHYIKLDMKLVRNVNRDHIKQALIKSMCEFASLTQTGLIAEGIETEEELSKLIEFGVNYGQGYFIQRPDAELKPISDEVYNIVLAVNERKNRFVSTRIYDLYIKNISRKTCAVNPGLLCQSVETIFKENEQLQGLCVVENEIVVGVITKNKFYKHLGGQYGFSLFLKRPISYIMDREFLSVDYHATIDTVARKAMARPLEEVYNFITVTCEGKYFGTVSVMELLGKSIETMVLDAKNLNPLSELPGNVLIEKQLERIVGYQQDLIVLYFDIDNFKAYNDVYGFTNGDRVIRYLTKILKESAPGDNFIGHIGGDDFLMIAALDVVSGICDAVISKFDQGIHAFYSSKDFAAGYIQTKNRSGMTELFPLMTLSVVGVKASEHRDIYSLGKEAGKLKKICKQTSGSCRILL
ncbi:MAG: GGDEF domain-containing protein [Clostridiales bacterium]|nr:GGDEF domain-containing protein [Clostridiales bacterium]